MEKIIPNTHDQKAISHGHKQAPPDSIFPTHDTNLNHKITSTNYPNLTQLETNNVNLSSSCNTSEDAHIEDTDTTENHDSNETNEEDMVT